MATIDELSWESMTAVVNEIKSPNQFLLKLLYRNRIALTTETIAIDVLTRAREVAPFVRKNGEALLVEGHGSTRQLVDAPNIRIKRPMEASDLLFGRKPGSVIFPPQTEQVSAIGAHIARELQVLADLVTNAEEYLAALSLQGTISYSVTPEENFTITYPKPAGHNITLVTFWDDADPSLPEPEINVHAVKRLLSAEVGLGVTDAICGSEAADAFMRLAKNQKFLFDKRDVNMGGADFTTMFNEDGAIFLGRAFGVNFWEYSRTATVDGSSTNMLRAKYIEFVSATPSAEFTMYYGAIADMHAFEGNLWIAQRFSKSWLTQDPSQRLALLHSRPLPVPRRPGAMVSMKVVSG